MNIRIYQINIDRSPKAAFLNLEALLATMVWSEVDGSIYDLVYDGDFDVCDAEAVYTSFNTEPHEGFKGHSLSVSDVVEMNGKFLYCDTIGFKQINFTPPVRMIRGFLLDVQNGIAEERTVVDSLDSYYKMLNCSCIGINRRVIGCEQYEIICDEEGTLKDDPKPSACNKAYRMMFVGSIFVTGLNDDDGNLTSLTDSDVKQIAQHVEYLPNAVLCGVEYPR